LLVFFLTRIEYEGFHKRIEYHCSILPGIFLVSLFIFYHRETMDKGYCISKEYLLVNIPS
jgi:hypothetical protein